MEWILLVIMHDLRGMDKDGRDKGRGQGEGKRRGEANAEGF